MSFNYFLSKVGKIGFILLFIPAINCTSYLIEEFPDQYYENIERMELLSETKLARYYTLPKSETLKAAQQIVENESRWSAALFTIPGIDMDILYEPDLLDFYIHEYVKNGYKDLDPAGVFRPTNIHIEIIRRTGGYSSVVNESTALHEFAHALSYRYFGLNNRAILEEGLATVIKYMYHPEIVETSVEYNLFVAQENINSALRSVFKDRIFKDKQYISLNELITPKFFTEYWQHYYMEGAAFCLFLIQDLGWDRFWTFFDDDRIRYGDLTQFNDTLQEYTGYSVAQYDRRILEFIGMSRVQH